MSAANSEIRFPDDAGNLGKRHKTVLLDDGTHVPVTMNWGGTVGSHYARYIWRGKYAGDGQARYTTLANPGDSDVRIVVDWVRLATMDSLARTGRFIDLNVRSIPDAAPDTFDPLYQPVSLELGITGGARRGRILANQEQRSGAVLRVVPAGVATQAANVFLLQDLTPNGMPAARLDPGEEFEVPHIWSTTSGSVGFVVVWTEHKL